MRLFFIYFKSELRRLLVSVEGTLYIFFQGLLIGISLYGAFGNFGNPGALPNGAAEPPQFPVAQVFQLCYHYFALFLPFVFSRLMSPRSEYFAIDIIARISGAGRIYAPRIAAGLAFLAISHALVMPALVHLVLTGGHIPLLKITLLALCHFTFGVMALAVTVFCSSLAKNRFSAIYSSVIILVLTFILEIMGQPYTELSEMSIGALLIIMDASVIMILLAYIIMTRGRPRPKAVAVSLFIVAGLTAAIAAFGGLKAFGPAFFTPVAGHAPIVSGRDLLGIPALYLGVFPLAMGICVLARSIKFSLIDPARKKAVVCIGSWLVIIVTLVLIQDFYLNSTHWKFFIGAEEIVPARVVALIGKFNRAGAENINRDLEKIDLPPGNEGLLHAGENGRFLKNFFRKLSDLRSGRTDVVRIVHYGDSLIWGDCFAKTVKRRFQQEFGDGGRGLVPPVETGATSLRDYVNKTRAEAFNLYEIKHRFRRDGAFYVRPEINPMIGFTGEGIYPVSPRSEIRLGMQDGFDKWKRVQVFLRSAADNNRPLNGCTVNLDYGSGKARKVVSLKPDGTAAATFDIPPAEFVALNFDWEGGGSPAVDAVNLETGSGIAYSTIVRMGIHMSWMNAVPERNLRELRTINPDLVIFQFGINEAASLGAFPEFTEEILRGQIREWLARVRALLPDTNVLLIGPPERLHMDRGLLVPMKETLVVRRVQAEEAAFMEMAFFDTYRLLGGEGHMLKLVKSGMAMNDYTHFTYKGGDFAAEGFFDMLMGSYQKKGAQVGQEVPSIQDAGIRFNSIAYLCFLAIVIAVGLILRPRPWLRFAFLVAASYYFYATWEAWPLLCLAATTITDFSMGRLIAAARRRGKRGSVYLALSLVIDLGILFALKYFDFFSGLAAWGLGAAGFNARAPLLNILLPAGISFYTFQSLSYTIDVWRGKIEPEKSLVRYAHYASLFTQLLAGPIVKAREFLPALKDKASHFTLTGEHASAALFLIFSGLIKKTAADWLGVTIVDRVFAGPQMFLPLETLAAVYAYGLQIYGDFSGYTDIAIGSAMLLGYNLTENFRRPYASASISEFWQRWHISLGSWLRDYVYIGLGGNRKRVLFNIGITMLVCGLWHGAALPFVVWGLYHGFFLILERVFGLNKQRKVNPVVRAVRVVITLHIVLFGWILFRSGSWTVFTEVLASLSKFTLGAPNVGMLLLFVMVLLYALHFTPSVWKDRLKSVWMDMPAFFQGCAASCATVFLYNIAVIQAKPFIYFQF